MRVTTAGNAFERQYGRITEAGIEALRDRIGQPIPSQKFGHPMPTASEEAIRLWAWGVADDNPLFTQRDYAASTRWGRLIAPPSIALGMEPHRLGIMGGLPGVHALYAGVNFTWHDAIREGVKITTFGTIKSVDERTDSRLSGRAVKVTSEARIDSVEGAPLVTMQHVVMRHERGESRERAAKSERNVGIPHRYSDAEIADISEQYRAEVRNRRGAERRDWDNVAVGDTVNPLLKGPLTSTGVVAFAIAAKPVHLIMGHRLAFQLFDQHPGVGIPNESNVPEPPSSAHWSESQAQFAGLPTAYDFGIERACWATHLFTDWMGDDAVLRSLQVRFRGLNYLGDLTRFTGLVVERFLEGDLPLIRCTFESVNQRGEMTTSGEAVLALPRGNSSPIDVLPFQSAR